MDLPHGIEQRWVGQCGFGNPIGTVGQNFGNNAAWFRFSLLSHNVLLALKRLALPPELVDARPKRLRFEVLWQAARLLHHARGLLLRISTKLHGVIERLLQGRKALLDLPAPS